MVVYLLVPTVLHNVVKLNFPVPPITSETDLLRLIISFFSNLKWGKKLWKKDEENSDKKRRETLKRIGRKLFKKEEGNSEKKDEGDTEIFKITEEDFSKKGVRKENLAPQSHRK